MYPTACVCVFSKSVYNYGQDSYCMCYDGSGDWHRIGVDCRSVPYLHVMIHSCRRVDLRPVYSDTAQLNSTSS